MISGNSGRHPGLRAGIGVGVWALLGACSGSHAPAVHRWYGMDTDFSAALYGRGSVPADTAFADLEHESQRLERVFSDFMPNSDLSRLLGKAGDTITTDPEIIQVFRSAQEMAVASRGRFDITLHRLKIAWGLASGDSGRIPTEAEIANAMRGDPAYHVAPGVNPALQPPYRILSDRRLLLLRDSAVFDLGGIAKGYTVDRLHDLLDSLGFPDHIVQAGGDLRLGGRKPDGRPWNVGIRHPRHSDSLAGDLTLKHPYAVSTSGDYERYFIRDGIRYHHIFDPYTGRPARPYCSVTVLAATSEEADRLSKPLFILGPAQSGDLLQSFHAEAVWIRADPAGLCYTASAGMLDKLSIPHIPPCPPDGL